MRTIWAGADYISLRLVRQYADEHGTKLAPDSVALVLEGDDESLVIRGVEVADLLSFVERVRAMLLFEPEEAVCRHCDRLIVLDPEEGWIDRSAGYDDENGDGMWRFTCDAHDTVFADHEPRNEGGE